jgi:hypothetical protein
MSRQAIPQEKLIYIKQTYKMLETGKMGFDYPPAPDWQHVYAQGGDSKYGTIVYSDSLQAWRGPSFDEFYGGAAVD